MGRAAWESVAALEVPGINKTHVAILIGDDRGDAPLLLYVGEKKPGGNFLERNGLTKGRLYASRNQPFIAAASRASPTRWSAPQSDAPRAGRGSRPGLAARGST